VGTGEEAAGLCSFDVLNAETVVIVAGDSGWMHLLWMGPRDGSVGKVQLLLVVISPVVLWLLRIGVSLRLKDPILVDVLHLKPRDSMYLSEPL
jgi:hypothetical protein